MDTNQIQRKAIVSKLLKVINMNQPVKGTYVKSIKPEDIFDTETPTTTLYPIKAGNSTILVPLVDINEQAKPAINPDLALKILSKVSDPKQKDILKNYIIQTQKQEVKKGEEVKDVQEVKLKETILKKTKEAEQQQELKKKEFEKNILTPEQLKEAMEKKEAKQKEIKEKKIKSLEKANLTKEALKGAEDKTFEDLLNELLNQVMEEDKEKLKDVQMKTVLTKEELNEKYPLNERTKLYSDFRSDFKKAKQNKDIEKLKELYESDKFRVFSTKSKINDADEEIIKYLSNLKEEPKKSKKPKKPKEPKKSKKSKK